MKMTRITFFKNKKEVTLVSVCVAVLLLIHLFGAQLPFTFGVVLTEHFAPGLISTKSWVRSVEASPEAHGYSAYGILIKRDTDAAIPVALLHLNSSDPYIWMNAAHYLGSQGQVEAVPYLIKALRHHASRSNDKRVAMLQELTGQEYEADFEQWLAWYRAQPEHKELDWESSLGR